MFGELPEGKEIEGQKEFITGSSFLISDKKSCAVIRFAE